MRSATPPPIMIKENKNNDPYMRLTVRRSIEYLRAKACWASYRLERWRVLKISDIERIEIADGVTESAPQDREPTLTPTKQEKDALRIGLRGASRDYDIRRTTPVAIRRLSYCRSRVVYALTDRAHCDDFTACVGCPSASSAALASSGRCRRVHKSRRKTRCQVRRALR